ncbi:hypothetical protein GCM10009840_24790 [Pseudolysinimonas kribbensis]|uniref:Uncharacterized protein n=1 Tax=Pseudolysinimonas kribbensis TaxID=433641 RepID=A0ABQ6K9Y7_9MICO|nr:hypothetical protein [Pseudolysinimonas kribbensis]GMA96742.1 hypothetical protein GCM10025881_35660 [Pseudolysinimonas kribbensis]
MSITGYDPQAPLDRTDRGEGKLNDYTYGLLARNRRIRLTLAGSDACQDELIAVLEQGADQMETAVSPRTQAQEKVDAPIVVRLFTGRRVSGPVGMVPRGLESVVDENLRRLDDAFGIARIPVAIVRKRGRLRVQLLMGAVRDKLV